MSNSEQETSEPINDGSDNELSFLETFSAITGASDPRSLAEYHPAELAAQYLSLQTLEQIIRQRMMQVGEHLAVSTQELTGKFDIQYPIGSLIQVEANTVGKPAKAKEVVELPQGAYRILGRREIAHPSIECIFFLAVRSVTNPITYYLPISYVELLACSIDGTTII